MKKLLSVCIAFLAAATPMFGQNIAEIKVFLENENYLAARKMANQLIAADATNASAYFYMGESYYEDEKADSAKIWYEKGSTANPKNLINQIGLGKLLLDNNKPAEAKKIFDQAVKATKSKNAEILYQIGVSYLRSSNRNADEAVKYLTLARDLNTKNPDYFLTLGDAYLYKGDGGNAMTNFESAIEKDAKNPRGYMRKAKLAKGAKIIEGAEGAIATYEKCISIDPNYAPAYKDLIELYYAEKKYSKVTELLAKYTQLVGNDIDARMRYVRFLVFQAKDYETAITEAQKVLQDDPKQYSMYRWLAWAQYEKGDYPASLASSKKLFENIGDNKVYASDYEYYANAALKNKDMTTAIAQWRNIMKLDSTKTDYYDQIAKYYFEEKDYPNAIKSYEEKMTKVKPSSSDYYYIGRSYYNLKDYKKADDAFLKVTELNATWPSGYAWRARSNDQLDPDSKLGLALPHYQKMISIAQSDPAKYSRDLVEAYLYMGYHYYQKNDLSAAKANYTEVIKLDPSNKTANDALSALNGSQE
ncbi:MAG: tetratricopeptide repeat protein [Chitinophagales bacterium]|jgi:tetratricopeptide (TPR) repeat protein|nr:tetratricopeptide repeat protein [Chitinophagales bacterium]